MSKITKIKNNNLKRFGIILCTAIALTFSLTGCGSDKKPHEFQIVESGANLYVSGYVDSQNGFGAMLRNKFKVTFNYLGAEIDKVYIY